MKDSQRQHVTSFVTVCYVSKLLRDSFLCRATTQSFSFVWSVLKYAHTLWCWKGLSPMHDYEAPTICRILFGGNIRLLMLNVLYCVETIPSRVIAKLSWHWKTSYGRRVCGKFPSDYLPRELELGDRFGRRSGRGWSTGCRPWRYPWMGRLLSPLK